MTEKAALVVKTEMEMLDKAIETGIEDCDNTSKGKEESKEKGISLHSKDVIEKEFVEFSFVEFGMLWGYGRRLLNIGFLQEVLDWIET